MQTLEEAKNKFHRLKSKFKTVHSSLNSSFRNKKSIDTVAKTSRPNNSHGNF